MFIIFLLFVVNLTLITLNGYAQEVSIGGQIRPRYEFRDPVNGDNDSFTSMRMRANISAKPVNDVGIFIQLEDVRLWGEEKNTLTDFRADNFDMHQAYFNLQNIGGSALSLRVGRQEISLGGQRLVGAVNWTQQGRAFDGVRATLNAKWGNIDFLGIKLKEDTAPSIADNSRLIGAHTKIVPFETATLELFALNNAVSATDETDQWTLGLRWFGEKSLFSYRVEGAYQAGERRGNDVSAYMYGVRAGSSILNKKGKVTLWYDYLSGDDCVCDDKTKVFDTLFATNHKFYGFADLFLNIPLHTQGLGLQDLAIKTSFSPREKLSLALDLHAFILAQKSAFGSRHLGEEIDLTVNYKYRKNVTFVSGLSNVFAKEGFADLGRLDKDFLFAYLMTNVTF